MFNEVSIPLFLCPGYTYIYVYIMIDQDYIEKLEKRAQSNRIVKEFQDTALYIAELLNDKKHTALYMKLAKQHPKQLLMRIAASVAERGHIDRKGAYFMKILKEEGHFRKQNNTSQISNDKKKNRHRGEK